MTVAACPPSSPVTPGVVVFNFNEFIGIYPEFTTAGQAACQNWFNIATLYCSNCCRSIISDPNVRQTLLYLLTAHITFLFTACGANNNQPPGIVGRIDSATEGSVSVSAEYIATQNNSWFVSTKYGANFWNATAAVRAARYVPPPAQCAGPGAFGGYFGPLGLGNGYPPY